MTYLRDVLERELSPADDRFHPNPGGPPPARVAPHLRIGKRWFNTVWLIPLSVVLLVAGVVISRTSCHGARARICLGLCIVVNRRGRHAATRWKRTAD